MTSHHFTPELGRPAKPFFTLARLAVAAAACAAASLAGASPQSDARSLYDQEMATCQATAPLQGRETCIREAKAAYGNNLRGVLASPAADMGRNINLRCDALKAEDRMACLARMRGEGTTSGTVSGGGIYRELVTIIPAEPVAPTASVAPVPPAVSEATKTKP